MPEARPKVMAEAPYGSPSGSPARADSALSPTAPSKHTQPGPKHQWVKPDGTPERYCTFTQLAKHLKISHRQLRAHCTALNIDLKPGRRRERYPSGRLIRKAYKRHLRFLTQSEVTRILVRHYEAKGQRIQRKKEPTSA